MVTAIVLINAERDSVREVAESLHQLKGVAEVYSVAGQYDLVAILRAKDNEEIADIVTSQLLKLEGIQKTETLIAFGTYSRYDLDHLFSIGQEQE
ncbi:MAG TPA: Lrp/AsnC family transcriptional regulator [Candidatus Sumerlaeota bacterium]|nr:MAG: DNA-binding transcriptional regulator AsnC [candidate division BRC1 bacterium ADurb.Bin183]HOE64314.1 Lrp/AsnC family transcriptional regulator [Candidatus Sumerlaeota bacterium]HRR31722.1 Lrp/AsnC family transcriptional regulator [Candidatus Sumerlaeia bacterium]HON49657.1 Lrp/AsnC family transcriptional regulator [Candidatus Sumerlaeota bacterium]HOR65782.1 Lrp/AsnC family transcriptional regulator [Candidatus Sumerlaeota bacterium]